MSMENPIRRIAGEIDRMKHHYLVGREREIRFFLEWLTNDAPAGRILNLYGTGGIGKSYLLDEFRRISEKDRVRFLYADSRAFPRTPAEFCSSLLRLLSIPVCELEKAQTDIRLLTELCVAAIQKAAREGKLVIALDTFEEFGEMEHWLREEFLPRLPSEISIVISGRLPLQGAWSSSPAWRRMICRMPLSDLPFEAVKQYLERAGVDGAETCRHIWDKTKGHPLTLSLFVATTLAQHQASSSPLEDQGIFPYIVSVWLKEVPDRDIRELVEAAAVLRHFNQEMLSFILEKQVATEQFLKLTGHSFVRRSDRGWTMHDLLRDAVSRELRLRTPEYYDRLWKRCVLYYFLRIHKADPKSSVAWETAEWVYYVGGRSIRTLYYRQPAGFSLEPLHPSNLAEAERFLDYRRRTNIDTRVVQTDIETNERYEYVITAEEGRRWIRHFHMQELFELDPGIVKLIRGEQRNVFGMAVVFPIHEGTLDYLRSHPPSSTYFSSLSESKLQALRTPREAAAGHFIASIDVADYGDPAMRQAAGLTFISYMLPAGLVVTTSPPIPFLHSTFLSLGFDKAEGIVHYDYDDRTPTPYFVMDTRGKKLLDYMRKMTVSIGIMQDRTDGETLRQRLSRRETEVFDLLRQGKTNADIALELFLSEATVKKHVFNIFTKLQVKNRIQLMNKFRD